jgi:hypothetical protein
MMFKVGDMVVPINKSIGCSLREDDYWRIAQSKKQPFLYIARVKEVHSVAGGSFYHCNYAQDAKLGNHYKEKDLIPYEINEDDLFQLLIEGKIDHDVYTTWLKGCK